ncbi:hypothetical protein VKT23_012323 [Stygiomarasmius scandens]|uniref:Uncharacterized protein n=1 Tax=Marasmiellus scandens TaxID=2682957 RepID=A0ABR1J6L7_9AGAR
MSTPSSTTSSYFQGAYSNSLTNVEINEVQGNQDLIRIQNAQTVTFNNVTIHRLVIVEQMPAGGAERRGVWACIKKGCAWLMRVIAGCVY